MRLIIIIITTFFLVSSVSGQIMIGPNIGGLYQKYTFEDSNLSKIDGDDITSSFDSGYNAGLVFVYSAQKNISLQIEVLYAVKSKKLSGGIQDEFSHEAKYKFIEAPLTFKYHFPKKTYTAYIYTGGRFSHWLSGKGEIRSFEYDEPDVDFFGYNILFDEADIDDEVSDIFIEEPNRIQVGLDFGVGAFINTLNSKNKVMVDFGMQYGHSWLGRDQDISVGLDEYQEDYRSSSLTFALSVGYLFAMDIGQGKQGKSTSKQSNKPKRKRN